MWAGYPGLVRLRPGLWLFRLFEALKTLPHLGSAKKARVRFHLGGLISKPFETYCAAQWKRLPARTQPQQKAGERPWSPMAAAS